MNTQLLLSQIVSGIATGALYFLVAAGLTLIWGALHVFNIAHGSFFMIAAFCTTVLVGYFGPDTGFLLSLLIVPLCIGIAAVGFEKTMFRRVYSSGVWGQLLLTFGLMLVLKDLTVTIFGPVPRSISAPEILQGFIRVGGVRIAKYQLLVLFATTVIAIGLWWMMTRSRTGRLIRAAVDDPDMLGAVGVDVKRLLSRVMFVAAVLAGIAGVIAAPRGSVNPMLDVQIVIIAFAVIIIGGLGSVSGALIAAILVGVAEATSTMFIDQGGEVVIFALMALVLFLRPTGFRSIEGRG